MKQITYICSLALLILGFVSCEKEITIDDLPAVDRKVVVEGYIEQGKHPYVLVTLSAPYFAPIEELIDSLFIVDATVVVSDGVISDTLTLQVDDEIFAPLQVVAYKTNGITGEVGKLYSLTVYARGDTMTATTTIPNPVPLDSIWFKIDPESETDTLGLIWAHLSDPDTIGNAYRWFTKTLGRDARFLTPWGAESNDRFYNGQSFDFAYNQPENPVDPEPEGAENWWYFTEGDTVIVRLCSIDNAHYEFWESVDANGNGDNPFSAPANVVSNVNGGLGIWGGYGAWYDTIVCIPVE